MTPVLAHPRRADRSFERIYRRHVGDVYRYALAVLHHQSDAEDVTQTTFLNAYRAFQRGERPRNPQNWLIAIAHNVCRQRFRQAKRRPEEVAYDDGIGETVGDGERAPNAEDIQRALSQLAFNQRAALVMRELEGRSYGEIAEILGLSVSAIETLLFRARRALREQLEGTLTCSDAERAISRRADGRLPRSERAALRAHLRECRECERLARSVRAQRTGFKALALLPVASSLTSLFGGGAAGGAIAVKAAAVVAAGVAVTGVGLEGADGLDRSARPEARAVEAPAVAVRAPVVVAEPKSARALPAAKRASEPRTAKAKPAKSGRRAMPPGQVKKAARVHPQASRAKPKKARVERQPRGRSSAHAAKAPQVKAKAKPKKAKPVRPPRQGPKKAPQGKGPKGS